jgi:hypothetical protein
MRLPMKNYAEAGVLAGSIPGKRAFVDMVSKMEASTRPMVLFLDFKDVATMTASFTRDGVMAYRTHVRSAWPLIYPVAANLAAAVREEMELWLNQTGDAWVTCDLDDEGNATNPDLIGALDGKQYLTLKAVIALKETDVATLAQEDREVTTTAWNNRLVALADKGLVIETTSNTRNKRYKPVLEGLNHGR